MLNFLISILCICLSNNSKANHSTELGITMVNLDYVTGDGLNSQTFGSSIAYTYYFNINENSKLGLKYNSIIASSNKSKVNHPSNLGITFEPGTGSDLQPYAFLYASKLGLPNYATFQNSLNSYNNIQMHKLSCIYAQEFDNKLIIGAGIGFNVIKYKNKVVQQYRNILNIEYQQDIYKEISLEILEPEHVFYKTGSAPNIELFAKLPVYSKRINICFGAEYLFLSTMGKIYSNRTIVKAYIPEELEDQDLVLLYYSDEQVKLSRYYQELKNTLILTAGINYSF